MADEPIHPAAGHEERDVNVVAITKFGIGLAILIVVTIFTLWGLFNYFKTREAGMSPKGAATAAGQMPPEPRLERTPVRDLREIRAAEEQALNRYGWVDPDKGIVRIPVSRAMEILAQRGLKSRPQTEGNEK